jgi:purine-binding chemotaxis protein CheW
MSQGSLAVQQDSQLISFADQQEFVTMEVGGQLFGVSVMGVQDVLRNQTIANVPLSSEVVAGSLNLRGRIVTAIDMRVRLGMEPFDGYKNAMHVVVPFKEEFFSLVVDKVGEVMMLPMEEFDKVPANMESRWRELASGVFKLEKKLLIILNVSSIIT